MSDKTLQIYLNDLIELVARVARPKTKREAPIAVGTYCIVRCRDAGVHAGQYESHNGREVVLRDSRRIWRFVGAQTLSEIAVYGCTGPNYKESKIAPVLPIIVLGDACEIIPCHPAGESFLRGAVEYKC